MPTTPPSIAALPTPPSRSDSANFAARGDAFMAALPTFRSEANALGSNLYANAVEADADAAAAAASAASAAAQVALAAAQASAAANSALAAAASVNAAQWVSGTTYTAGQVVWSPATYLTYRRKSTGAGTTDPSLDPTNWAPQLPAGTPDYVIQSYGIV